MIEIDRKLMIKQKFEWIYFVFMPEMTGIMTKMGTGSDDDWSKLILSNLDISVGATIWNVWWERKKENETHLQKQQ